MPRPTDLTLTIHGLVDFDDQVDGEVWAEKFSAFMRGLAAADEAANGGQRLHRFVVADLRKNTATAQIAEQRSKSMVGGRSSCDFFRHAIGLVQHDQPEARHLPADLVKALVVLNRGAAKTFEFGEIKSDDGTNVVYLNRNLGLAAEKVLEDIRAREDGAVHFEGQAFGSFDGMLRAVDYQQAKKRGSIWLTTGDVPIPCDIGNVPVEEVSAVIEKRAIFSGLARYEATSPLPAMVEVRRIEPVAPGNGLAKWRGAFKIASDDDETWDTN